ncbi:MAG: carboxypeptidase regulatory-like domain-containing protein [Alphaproteobacteria bacterium]|nr:carboxypeptidase regulatory-like domain-containing protein [Alphaproteobacteria bacterium]
MTKSATFGDRLNVSSVNSGGSFNFTGITVTEDGVGSYNSFLDSPGLTLASGGIPTFLSPYAGLRWSSFGSGALAPGSSTTVTFNYNVTTTDAAKGINELQQSFTVDTQIGSGLTMQAVETIYDQDNNVVGRITVNLGATGVPNVGGVLPGANDFQPVAAYSSLRVEVTLTASVAADAPVGSAVNISILNNGFRQTTLATQAKIGDFVWADANNNGVQDSGEAGIAGVTVKLTNASGSQTYMTTTTDSTGKYEFANLNAGNYVVEFVKPSDYVFTGAGQGTTTNDSDANATTGRSGVITLAAGQVNTTVDAGLVKLLTLGDRVWLDADADGVQESGEAGLSGVSVTLTNLGTDGELGTSDDVVIGTQVTDGSGNYLFTGLLPGQYVANFTTPDGYLFSAAGQGGNPATDSNAGTTSETGTITLSSDDLTIDAGVYQTASLGDFVFNDANNNGVQDSGETGIEGVTVTLLNGSGADTGQTAVTDVNGLYSFDGLVPGTYSVRFMAPSGYAFSAADQGGDDTKDSDANALGTTGTVTLSSGQHNTTLDAGLVALRAIGDFAWVDANGNGVQDSGEAGLAGVSVTLTNLGANGVPGGGDDSVIGTQVTDGNGAYLFGGLLSGNYALQFTAPSGYVTTASGQGTTANDSNINSAGQTGVVMLGASDDLTIDAGFYKTASLGDFVWNDANQNGVQDSGEAGVIGLTVRLLDGSGAFTGTTTTTDINGAYKFDGLAPGSYAIQVMAPLTQTFTGANLGGDDTKDSDVNSLGISAPVTLTSGEYNNTLDAGIYKAGSNNTPVLKLGDFVWSDTNANGVQDLGEAGVAGVGVQLINIGTDGILGTADDKSAGSTSTDSFGKYLFSGLAPGSYVAQFTAPSGYLYSAALAGGNTELDSNATTVSGATGTTGTIVLTNADNLSVDAGLYQTASLGDFVWNDANYNGIQDVGEAGVQGVTVKLLNGSGADTGKSTTTDANGAYNFSGLIPGTYSVQFLAPSGFAFTKRDILDDTKDSDAARNGTTGTATLGSGQSNTTLDAGLVQLRTIGDFAWIDANANGVQDGGETGLAGVSVTLTNLGANGVLGGGDDSTVGTQTTGSNGAYLFGGLLPGSYALQFTAPTGYVTTAAGQGGDATLDSNINSAGQTGVVTLTTSDDLTVDAGFYQKASLDDFVWNDANANGIQDTGEAGVSGVTVRLLDGNGAATGRTTTTGTNGAYLFDNLVPGSYGIQVVAPSGYVFTTTNAGTDDTKDSDTNSAGISSTVVLRSGEFNSTLDAGLTVYCPPPPVTYKIGDRVWHDGNANGIQDLGEAGIACVSVKLINIGTDGVLGTADDRLIGTQQTDANGRYLFSNLQPGNYVAQFTAPGGFTYSQALAGTDRALDSNPTVFSGSLGTTQTIVLTNADNLTIDAGLYKTACLGNFVWLDADKDGIQEACEPGIAGVTVRLLSSTGVDQGRSTVTDASGYYNFAGLMPGSYSVQFVAPSGYAFTPQDRGTKDAVDSDANASGRTGTVTLASGQNNTTIDAGLFRTAAAFVQARPGLSPGFWSQHLSAWDANSCNDGNNYNLVCSGVLRRSDVMSGVANDCWGNGVLLGDINGDGYTNAGETTLFVPLSAAQQIIRSSDSGTDTRQILMKQAIAAQLNIYNGAGSPGFNTSDGIVGAEMITLATKWLRGMQLDSNSGMRFVFPDGTSGNVDARGTAGVLNTGTTNGSSVDFNLSTGAFNSTRLASSSNAWNLGVDADPTSSILRIDGEGLKNVLDAYNNNRLVMSSDGSMVAWKSGSSFLGVLADEGVNYLRVGANNGLALT